MILANLCLGILIFSIFSGRPADESSVPYGTRILSPTDPLLQDSFGQRSDGRLMVVFGNTETFQRYPGRLAYLNSLAERVNSERFKIVFSTVEDLDDELTAVVNRLTMNRDQSGRLHRSARIAPGHPHGGIAIISREGAIEFRTTGIPGEDELRRLAEKHAYGSIDYRPVSATLLSVFGNGQALAQLSMQPVSLAAHRVEPLEPGRTLVLFAASCAPCVLNEYLAELGALKGRISKEGDDSRLAVVFDESFDAKLLVDQLRDSRMPTLVYRANLRQLVTTPYETRTDALAAPLVVTLGADRTILLAQGLRLY